MNFHIPLQILVLAALMATCICNHTVIIMGPTGAGKSSLINFMSNKGTEVAKEGITYNSETFTTAIYSIDQNTEFIDTPGLLDTTGYTNEEITELIKSEIIQQTHHSITGVVLLFDGTHNRIQVSTMINSIIHILGAEILQNIIIAFNKNDKIDDEKRTMITEHTIKTLEPLSDQFNVDFGDIQSRVLFIDTKGEYTKYSTAIYHGMTANFKGNSINILESDKALKDEIETQYQMLLKDESNYKIWTEQIPHSEKKIRTVTVNVATAYSYQCNPHRICTNRIRFIVGSHCVSRRTVYDTCWGTKDVPTEKTEEYIDTWTENVTRKELKYDEMYLRQKAAKLVSDKIREKVYGAYRKRQKKEL